MSEFGQTLPAIPQIYWTQAQFSFTKTGLISHMCRALTTVGMIPLVHWWPYDALDSANAEIVLTQGNDSLSTYIFAFDFPDASTFSINNELWRPFICVVAYFGNVGSLTSSNAQNDYFRVDLGIRRDGAASLADSRGRYRQFTAAHFGWGNQGQTVTTNGSGGVGDMSRGCSLFKPDWKPWGSAAFTDNALLSVRNFFVYLGPAGLFVYLGTGATRDLFGSVMAAGFGFGGARLPDRAITPDPNLNRICPIIHLPMQETLAQIYNTGTGLLRTLLPAIQHDLLGTLGWTYANLVNLENSEIPFYPANNPNTLNSPRRLSSGQGAHILGRVVVLPKEQQAATSLLMGPINPRIISNDTRPSYSEVFAAPRLRFADVTAPLGDYQDPDTLENWRIVPHPAANFQLALYSENVNVQSTLSVGNKTLVQTRTYDLTSTTQTGTGAFPIGSPVTVASVAAGMDAALAHITISSNVGTSRWQSTAATDLLTIDMTPFINNDVLDLTWTMQVPPSDPLDSVYEFQFDMRVRGGTQDVNSGGLIHTINGVLQFVTVTDGVTPRTQIFSAGANTGHYAYDYKTYRGSVVRDVSQVTAPIVLRFRAQRAGTPDDTVVDIKAIRLNRYRYI